MTNARTSSTPGRPESGARVRRYYDGNLWPFLAIGSQRTIHRELWLPGVRSRREAVHGVHQLILARLPAVDDGRRPRVLDLGCGNGASAIYLAARRSVDVVGVSISPLQIREARRSAARRTGLRGSVAFLAADFDRLPLAEAGFDLAFAIESFVHSSSASAFLREAARVLRPGGRLVIVDDTLRGGPIEDERLEAFRTGWRINSLVAAGDVAAMASAVGLSVTTTIDLSRHQRLGRPRDRVIAALQPLLRWLRDRSVWASSLVGGHALQRCHRAGLLEYRLIELARADGSGPDPGRSPDP